MYPIMRQIADVHKLAEDLRTAARIVSELGTAALPDWAMSHAPRADSKMSPCAQWATIMTPAWAPLLATWFTEAANDVVTATTAPHAYNLDLLLTGYAVPGALARNIIELAAVVSR